MAAIAALSRHLSVLLVCISNLRVMPATQSSSAMLTDCDDEVGLDMPAEEMNMDDCHIPAATIADMEIAEEEIRLDDRHKQAVQEQRIELTDGQLRVCAELAVNPTDKVHVYGLQQALAKRYGADDVLSERAIANILNGRLTELGLVKKVATLTPNPKGPARQEYLILDRHRIVVAIKDETQRRRQFLSGLTSQLKQGAPSFQAR